MTSALRNFVTIRKTRGDVLNPTVFRTVVEMIRGILKKYDYSGLNDWYQTFQTHLTDYEDPHHDTTFDFTPEIIQRIYGIYTRMSESPLEFADFGNELIPDLAFLELLRRIVLNRYLYNQVKSPTGSVPSTANATLSRDWAGINPTGLQTTLSFGNNLASESDFINLGWNGNTAPLPVIFTGDTFGNTDADLPVIFATYSESPYLSTADLGSGYPIAIQSASNDISIELQLVLTPLTTTPIFTMRNGTDILMIAMTPTRAFQITLNGVLVSPAAIASDDGRLIIAISRSGKLVIQTMVSGVPISEIYTVTFTSQAIFTSGQIGVRMENLVQPVFGLRSLVLFTGSIFDSGPPIPPLGYAFIVDPDGAILTDPDGAYLIESAAALIPPDGYVFLTDDDGFILTDDDGSWLVDVVATDDTPPTGFLFLTDADGAILTDADGSPLVEAIDAPLTAPAGYAFLTDADGTYLTDADGSYLLEPA